MKVIFLDVDGVLNGSNTKERCRFPDGRRCYIGVEQSLCKRLRSIVKETDCHIVLSSTWRKHPDMLPYLWENLGRELELRCIGHTPSLPEVMQDGVVIPKCRGDEIQAWLMFNPQVKRFVILDDTDDMGHLMSHLIQTNGYTGLTDQDAERVIARLNT